MCFTSRNFQPSFHYFGFQLELILLVIIQQSEELVNRFQIIDFLDQFLSQNDHFHLLDSGNFTTLEE